MPDETASSTYCLVASSNADVGACVTVTEVSPASVVAVPPKATDVDPIVTELYCNAAFGTFDNDIALLPPNETDADPVMPLEYVNAIDEFVNDALPMFDSVLVVPSIVLLVNVSVVPRPTNVSVDVGSVRVPVLRICEIVGVVRVRPAIVPAVVPSEIVVDPTVIELFCNDVFGMFDNDSAFDPPNETDADPLIPPAYVKLIDELVSDPLPMLDNVLLFPSIVLLVNVSDVARPTNVSVDVGSVSVPVFRICAMIGVVNVLFVSV